MKLLEQIIESVTDTDHSTADVLRKCLVLAYRLKNEALKNWVVKELEGYEYDDPDLPDYRQSAGTARGLFLGAGGSQLRDQPLAPSILDEKLRHFANEIRLTQPIAAYEGADPNQDAKIPWPADLIAKYQSDFIRGMVLNRAWMDIPASMMIGLVDTARTRILKFALDIQEELPADAEKPVEHLAPEKVERMVQVIIHGGNNVIGNVESFNPQTVIAGDFGSLQKALQSLGLQPDDVKQLEVALDQDAVSAAGKSKGPGARTLEWIGKAARKLGGGAVKVTGAVAETAIQAAVMRYLGL